MNAQSLPSRRPANAAKHLLLSIAIWTAACGPLSAADGDVDPSFTPPRPDGWIQKIQVLSDRRILIAGTFTHLGATPRSHIARLMANGDIDPSFDPGTGPNGSVTGFALQPDGHLLIAGAFDKVGDQPRKGFARLTGEGKLDPAYAAAQPVISLQTLPRGPEIYSLPEGKALLVGPMIIFSFAPLLQRSGAIVLNADGSGDPTFNMKIPNIVGVQPVDDGKFLVNGVFTTTGAVVRNGLARLDGTGAVDPSFESPLTSSRNSAFPAFLTPDGRVIYVQEDGSGPRVFRVQHEGQADGSLQPPLLNGAVFDCAFQSDGKMVIGGDFTEIDRQFTSPRLARFNSNGSFDSTFGIGDGGGSTVFAVAIQADGRVLVGGAFQSWNNTDYAGIVRLMAGSGPPPPPSPRLSNPTYAVGNFTVSVPTQPGSQYSLQFLSSLGGNDWSTVSPVISGDGTPKTLSHSAATGAAGFYRVSVH